MTPDFAKQARLDRQPKPHFEDQENNGVVIAFALCAISGFVVGFLTCGVLRWIL
jgi:hypothetical protein